MIEQGQTVEVAFDGVDGTIDNMTTTVVFSHCKPDTCGEIAEEQEKIDDSFIYSRGEDIIPQNHEVVSAHRVSPHLRTNVT